MSIFEALTVFDWITPTKNAIQCATGMRPISVYWSPDSPRYYEGILRQAGIRASSGGIVAGKGFILMVPAEDLENARIVLENAGADLA